MTENNTNPSGGTFYAPAHLVTEESRKAWHERELRIKALTGPVMDFIAEHSPSASTLFSSFDPRQENDVREAMWRLLDADSIELSENKTLVATGK